MEAWSRSQLIRMGLTNLERAQIDLGRLEEAAPALTGCIPELISAVLDPDQALASLVGLAGRGGLAGLGDDPVGWQRLMACLGGSTALGRWLEQRPGDIERLWGPLDLPGAATVVSRLTSEVMACLADAGLVAAIDQLRWSYRRELLAIAAADLTADAPLELVQSTSRALTDLNDAVVQAAWRLVEATNPDSDSIRLAIIAMGKNGAREANYLSDVDLIYLAEPARGDTMSTQALTIGSRLIGQLTNFCSSLTAAGSIWEIDANLRPEGSAGQLVRSLAAMDSYYHKWARNWEFQALMKARPVAGDIALGQDFVDLVQPLIWQAAERDDFLTDAQAMRQRVIDLLPRSEAERNIKLSAGGLRDVEFPVQLLCLVHGRNDQRLRAADTLSALAALTEHGYIGRDDGALLADHYRLQRLMEHRQQLQQMKRTHLTPNDQAGWRRLARALRLRDGTAAQQAWLDSKKTVRRLQRRLFYSPLLAAVAQIPSSAARLTTQAAVVRLKALGYADPNAALRHISALTAGMSRRAEIMRSLLPAMLGWLASGPNPDSGLLAFRTMAESLGATPFFLRALRDEGRMAQNLAQVLATSRFAANLLNRSPANVAILIGHGEAHGTGKADLRAELAASIERGAQLEQRGQLIRSMRNRELLRVAMAEVIDHLPVDQVGQQLSDLWDVVVNTALVVAEQALPGPVSLAIIALGRWGGRELTYGSDADLMVVTSESDDPDLQRLGEERLSLMRRLLQSSSVDPGLELDLGLRPEGKKGPMLRSLKSTLAYYQRWAQPWEAQALLRARFGGGDRGLADQFLSQINWFRYPAQGLDATAASSIRRLKARMETERIGRGVDPRNHVKLGPGGLSDVEWTVQMLQLQHGHQLAGLRVTGTLAALEAAQDAGLINQVEATRLRAAFEMASRIRNGNNLLAHRDANLIPANAQDLGHLAQALGYPRGQGSTLADDWHRTARLAKGVTDRVFWASQ